jgi:hypothetical protein
MSLLLIGVYYKDPRHASFCSELCDAKHLVSTSLKFIRHGLDPDLPARRCNRPHDIVQMRGRSIIQTHERKNPHIGRHPA